MLNAVLIGCGSISSKHIEAFAAVRKDVRLVAVCDVARANAEKTAKSCLRVLGEAPRVCEDYAKLLEQEHPDIVAIATPSFTHHEIALAAFRAGCHVILEKPIALSTKHVSDVVLAANAAKRKATVCYISRFAPHIRELDAARNRGDFGRIFAVAVNVHWNRGNDYYSKVGWRGTWAQDGGMLMNQCTHGIDLLQWILGGKAVRVQAVARRFFRPIEAEDFASVTVEFDNGSVGTIVGTVDVYPSNLDETLRVFGEKGTVVIGGTHLDTVETWTFSNGRRFVAEPSPSVQGHAALYEDFVAAILNDREPGITLEDAMRSVEIVLAAYQSVRDGQAITLPVSFSTAQMKGVNI